MVGGRIVLAAGELQLLRLRAGLAGCGQRLRIGVAIRRFSSLRVRAWTTEKPMPHIPVPMMFMPRRPGISQSM